MKTTKKQTKPKNVNNSYFSTEKQAIRKAKTFGELYNAGSPLVDVGIPTPSPDEKENTLLKEWQQVIKMLRQKYRILRNEASREHPNVHLPSVPSRNADLTDILDCCTEAARLLSSKLTGQSNGGKVDLPNEKSSGTGQDIAPTILQRIWTGIKGFIKEVYRITIKSFFDSAMNK